MKLLSGPILLMASAAAAQVPPTAPPALPAAQTSSNPAAQYITAGQDEPGYRSWYLAAPDRAAQVKAFNDYLDSAQVGGILPTWQLLRTATAWKDCGGQPFEVPPSSQWPHMIQTLRYVRDHVIPAIGPVEAVSVYRNPALNKCAGGAPASAHTLDSAIDLVPLRPIGREELMRTLCAIHSKYGAPYNAGLGFYAFLRFHIDTIKFRRWNMDPAVAADCPPIIHPGDAASVGQPLPPPVTPPAGQTAPSVAPPDAQAPPKAGAPENDGPR